MFNRLHKTYKRSLVGRMLERFPISYWNDGAREVDYIVSDGKRLATFEIKSSWTDKVPGLHAFERIHPDTRCCLVGGQGMDLETFFSTPAADFLGGDALRTQ